MRKILLFFIFISFLLKGCLEDAEMTPRYYPLVFTDLTMDRYSGYPTFYGKIEEGADSIVEYGFAFTLKEDTYLPGNFITVKETGYKNYSLTLDRGLLPDTKYQVRAYAKTNRFNVLGAAAEMHTHNNEPEVKDIDGNPYHTIVIGNQEWMVENLRVTRYKNGNSISTFDTMEPDGVISKGAYGIYPYYNVYGFNSEEEITESYGLLYNGYTIGDSRGLCPAGWRIPSDEDWMQLEGLSDSQFGSDHPEWLKHGSRGTDAGFNLRSEDLWNSSSVNQGRNHFGFSAFPGGYFDANDTYNNYKGSRNSGYYWTQTTTKSGDAVYRMFEEDSKAVRREAGSKEFGMSVRCMRDVVFGPEYH